MKTLKTIQKLSKVGKILCTVIFILCLVGAIGCVVGIIGLAVIPESIKIGDLTIHGIIEKNAKISMGSLYAVLAMGLVYCIGEAVLCKIAKRYFVNELEAGTPFTFDVAKELIRLGILTICIPVGTTIVAAIVFAVMAQFNSDITDIKFSNSISAGLGIMFIITGLICRHGAEVSAANNDEEQS